MTYKLYRQHNCSRSHRTFHATATCIWPRAVWIHGEGPHALLAWCHVLTVTLWDDVTGAQRAKEQIDWTACGGRCEGRHEIVEISADLVGASRPAQRSTVARAATPAAELLDAWEAWDERPAAPERTARMEAACTAFAALLGIPATQLRTELTRLAGRGDPHADVIAHLQRRHGNTT